LPFYSVLSVNNNWLSAHSETVTKLLKALAQAQTYLENHPTETQQIIKNRFNYTDSYMATVWSRNNCSLTLTPTLTYVMQNEAAWMIRNNLTTQTAQPTIANYINATALKEVKPAAVTIP
jgi:ABC-type nitrate/sulfonate/bicarbonate transport system substrate-binding protein